jgi:hypothetical protein
MYTKENERICLKENERICLINLINFICTQKKTRGYAWKGEWYRCVFREKQSLFSL